MTKEKRDAANARLIHMFRHIPAIAALTADRDKWRNRCERLIGHYGDDGNWYRPSDDQWHDGYMPGCDGYDFAQQIQKEIDDDTPTEKMSQSTAEK